jgi:hypothetical protein
MSGRLNSPYTFADVCNISIDEARYDRRLSSIEHPGPLTRELPDLPAAPYGYEVVILHRERFSLRLGPLYNQRIVRYVHAPSARVKDILLGFRDQDKSRIREALKSISDQIPGPS